MKEDLLAYGRLMRQRGYIRACEGNLSVRSSAGTVYVTPTGSDKGSLKLSDVVEVGLHGRVSGGHNVPSSDLDVHLGVYRLSPGVRAVLHAHSPRAVRIARGEEPRPDGVRWAQKEEDVAPALAGGGTVILAGHGAYAAGRDLASAFDFLDALERGT